MHPEKWEKVKEAFNVVVDLALEERTTALESACGGDLELRAEVYRLLSEYDRAGEFLDAPIVDAGRSLEAGELVDKRYEIVRLVGRGGMGEVYEAHDQLLGETVALKTLRPELAQDRAMIERFQKEILTARKVTHPNVCRVFEVGVEEGLHYFTMELLEGETLAARIKREGGLKAEEAIPLIRQMAQGLEAAHQAGIVHRDFKSANVILDGDRAVVTDFGLARVGRVAAAAGAGGTGADTGVTIGQMAGTVGYMSPEQLTGEAVTAASDIYSLGIVLFEMAAGKLPFDGTHLINSAVQRASGRVPWIRKDVPDIDARWETAIERCLQPDPVKRFSSAGAVAEHFNRRPLPRLPRLASRRKWWLLVTAAPLTALMFGLFRPAGEYAPKQEAVPWYEKGVESVLAMTYESGRKALEKAVSLEPGYGTAHAYLAAALSELDKQSDAREEMLKAMAETRKRRLSREDMLRVEALQHMVAREFDAALPLFSELAAMAETEREKAAGHVQLAWLEQKRQNLDGTERNLKEALRLNPSNAGAKLRMAMVLGQKQDVAGAVTAFGEAEGLFRAASDSDGVTEVLWQQARLLARANRSGDSLKLAERGLAIAASTGNSFHEIRLQLARALAYRNAGDVNRSKAIAEEAVRTAVGQGMDGTAAVGLLDLGSAYLLRAEPEAAERYFQQGLAAARTGRADFSAARAALSLASLYVQYDRPVEALAHIERALPFFRGGGHRREAMQGLLLLGGAQTHLARFEEAERTLKDAVKSGEELRDREQHGLARGCLSAVYDRTGRWPEAVKEASGALELFGDLRGGYRAAHVLASRARMWTQLGQFDKARADIVEGGKWAERAAGNQAQVKALLTLASAEIAYIHGRWAEASGLARKSAALRGGEAEVRQAELFAGLCAARQGSAAAAHAAIAAMDSSGDSYWAARGRLLLAEATGNAAEAGKALRFFEPLANWDAVWRCRQAMGGGVAHGPAKKAALEELRRNWPPEAFRGYMERPDFRRLGAF